MDRIIVEVDDASADKWRNAPQQKKEQLSETINIILQSALNKKEDDFWLFMDRVGKQAQANGLTQEILDDLLNAE